MFLRLNKCDKVLNQDVVPDVFNLFDTLKALDSKAYARVDGSSKKYKSKT